MTVGGLLRLLVVAVEEALAMAKERDGSSSLPAGDVDGGEERHRRGRSRKRKEGSSEDRDEDSADEKERGSRKKRKQGHHRSSRRGSRRSRRSSYESESGEDSSTSASYSESSSDDSISDSDSSSGSGGSEEEERRRKRRRKDKERRHERERRRKEKERRRRKKIEERKKKKKKEKTTKKKEKDLGKKGAVTNSWGKYGIIRETDMWNKRPEFTAWLAEVKKVNLESLANWEEKQMFKEFMEDHNTATFPSKKYYDLDAYHMRMMTKDIKKASKKHIEVERTVFNDEELRRQELMRARERQKDEQVEALKRSMQTGMAQAMKEQAQLKEEMAYQYKLGNFEAAAAIQRRLDPDIAM